jgi:hypothetical protein
MMQPSRSLRSKLAKPFASLALTALALLVGGASVSAQANCRSVHGQIEAFGQTPPSCQGEFCSVGVFRGGITGDYVVATTLNPDQLVEGIYFYTGDTTAPVRIGNRTGTLQIKNTGLFRASGELTELETITGGTDELTGASGVLFVAGISGEESGYSPTKAPSVCPEQSLGKNLDAERSQDLPGREGEGRS